MLWLLMEEKQPEGENSVGCFLPDQVIVGPEIHCSEIANLASRMFEHLQGSGAESSGCSAGADMND